MECSAGDKNAADDRSKRFILVVDGNAVERFYTVMLLQRFAYSVCSANTQSDAMEFMSTAKPALVVADAGPDGVRGEELLRGMKNSPSIAAVPVVILSSSDAPAIEARCRAAGCKEFLKKPIRAEELYRTVQHLMEKTPRRNLRVTTYLKANIGGDSPGASYATVLSEDGMFVMTSRTLPVGTRVPVNLVIEGKAIMVDALVLYSYGFGEGPLKQPGMGMKFERITPEDKAVIRSFVIEKLEEGLPKKT